MTALAGLLHVVALVLVISGAQKVLDPAHAGRAMRTARFGAGPDRVRGTIVGVVEVTTGLAAIATPHQLATAWLATFYVALAVFVVVLRRRDATAGCGCFGAATVPPGRAHLAANLACAVIALAATATGTIDVVDVARDAGTAIPYLVLLLTGSTLLLLGPVLLTELSLRESSTTQRVRHFGPVA